jgi:hypothetical protein
MTVAQSGLGKSSLGKSLRNRLVDSPGSLAETFRDRRWKTLTATFPDVERMHVVDLGGTVSSWLRAPVRPAHVTVLGFEPDGADDVSWIDSWYADACNLPAHLSALRADLVYSNAVLEHVGGAEPRQRFAASVHRLAPCHWVQTPYRYFPIEPHWLFPGFQFLPVAARVAIGRRWKLVHSSSSDYDAVLGSVLSVDLVGLAEFRRLFGSSTIEKERFAGMTKSLIAIKTG